MYVGPLRRFAVVGAGTLLVAGCSSSPAAQLSRTADPLPTSSVGSGRPAPASSDPSVDPALACVARLPLDVRIGQTMLVTTTDLPRVRGWLDEGLVAGVMASGRLTPALAGALDEATSGTRYGALLAADEEGGEVQRYGGVIGAIPSAQQQALTLTPDEVRTLYADQGAALADWGVDLVLAPVVDVGHGPGIGSRSYAQDPHVVARYAGAAAQGYSDAGLLPVLKHFPGHGRATGDSHYALVEGPGIAELREVDLVPFRRVSDEVEVGVMVGHTTIPGYSDTPSSQSARVIEGLLVGELGFTGLIVSDALGMEASGQPSQGDALVGFVAAGGDLGIVGPGGSVEGRRAMRAALASGEVGEQRIDDAAATVLAVKGIDPSALVDEPAPKVVEDPDVPSDAPVINPTEVP